VDKARKALKYSAAGVTTTLCVLGMVPVMKADSEQLAKQGTSRNRVAVTASLLIVMTWTATLL
jgi:hypothetical protein